jgi:hypothetical protein
MVKTCSKCGETKPLEDFHSQKDGKFGRRGDCKVCLRAAQRKHRDENRELYRQRDKDRYPKEAERRIKYARAYYKANVEEGETQPA